MSDKKVPAPTDKKSSVKADNKKSTGAESNPIVSMDGVEPSMDDQGPAEITDTKDQQGKEFTMKVRDPDETLVNFKIRTNTPFWKVLNALCLKRALVKDHTRLVYDGQRVNLKSTPEDLGMEDGAIVDAFNTQSGGGDS
ncbi:hypothetical protein CYMTET_25922 [Cymbomonas tetramitiformis]|uniref:Ubiquitin-like domain-containing protein n=1 Tax=Cymbomonas tetramitiformis TaxID=36881 RepID=A0AAE0FSS4_9CHLO|nr:hypothetical protein CYMTET_25922 [Cymbomonas tetramitiformis]|eukprot:gene22176-26736_t